MTKFVKVSLVAALAAFALTACGGGGESGSQTASQSAAEKPAVAAKPATATISGKVTFTGTAPKPSRVKMGADPYCVEQHDGPVFDSSLIVGADGSLENVFVFVKSGLEGQTFPTPSEPVVFDQKTCEYNPHIFGIRPNQPLEIINSDATLHNVHATPKNSPEFNVGMPTQGMKITKKFKNPEIMVHIKCEVHPWMSAYAGVVDNPYFAVAGKGGSFTLPKIPAGTYTLEAWHETLGVQTAEVTIGDGESKEVDFTFAPAAGS